METKINMRGNLFTLGFVLFTIGTGIALLLVLFYSSLLLMPYLTFGYIEPTLPDFSKSLKAFSPAISLWAWGLVFIFISFIIGIIEETKELIKESSEANNHVKCKF